MTDAVLKTVATQQLGRAGDERAARIGRLHLRRAALILLRFLGRLGDDRGAAQRDEARGGDLCRRLRRAEAVQLAGLGRDQELVVDDMMIGDPAPQPAQHIVAVRADLAGPLPLLVDRVQPFGGVRKRGAPVAERGPAIVSSAVRLTPASIR